MIPLLEKKKEEVQVVLVLVAKVSVISWVGPGTSPLEMSADLRTRCVDGGGSTDHGPAARERAASGLSSSARLRLRRYGSGLKSKTSSEMWQIMATRERLIMTCATRRDDTELAAREWRHRFR